MSRLRFTKYRGIIRTYVLKAVVNMKRNNRKNNQNIKKNNNKISITTDQNNNNKSVVDNKLNDSLSNQKYSFDLVNSWINNVDNKVTIATSLTVGFFGVLTYFSDKISISHYTNPTLLNNFCFFCYIFSLVLGFICLVFSMFYYVKALIPNLKSNGNEVRNKKYPLYFGDIAKVDSATYRDKVLENSSKDFLLELIFETHYNSSICNIKMKNYSKGIKLSYIAVGIAVLNIILKLLLSF